MTTLPPVKIVNISTVPTIANQSADVIVVVLDETDLEHGKIKNTMLQTLDSTIGGAVAALAELKDFEGKWLSSAVTLCSVSTVAKRVVLIGAGKKTDEKPARARAIGLKIAEETARFKAAKATVCGSSNFLSTSELVAQVAVGLRLGSYKYPNSNLSAEVRKELETPVEFKFAGLNSGADVGLKDAGIIADSIETCRLLQDAPPNVATPKYVAEVMSEKAPASLSRSFAKACNALGLKHIRTRPYTPRTNGKAERFIQALCKEWTHAMAFQNSKERDSLCRVTSRSITGS